MHYADKHHLIWCILCNSIFSPTISGYHPRTPRLVLAPAPTKHQQSAHQWASTLASRLKIAHTEAATHDLQAKQRRVTGYPQEPNTLHVGDSVMMYAPPPRPGFPTKLQSCWQGPFIIVKCLEGNTYRIRHPKKFRKRLLRHRDQLRVLHTRPERLQSTHGENLTGPPTVVPTTLSPGLTVSMPPQSRRAGGWQCYSGRCASALHQSGQVEDSVIREGTPSPDTHTRGSLCPRANIAAPSVPAAHLNEGNIPDTCPRLPLELRWGKRS